MLNTPPRATLGSMQNPVRGLLHGASALLSVIGAAVGLLLGGLGSWGIGQLYPDLPVGAPWWAVLAAVSTATLSGLVFGILPARRAAALDPVDALARR